jgi:N-methylhydantoinase A
VSLADPRSGDTWSVKVPTDPADPSSGFERGVRLALDAAGVDPNKVARTSHATTIATNAILEHTLVPTALVCSEGFRHVLEIGRHDGPRRTNLLHWVKPPRPVTADRVFEVPGRVSPDGRIEAPLDEARAGEVAERLVASGVEAVAVCLIDAYASPVHERLVGRIIEERGPGVPVSLSSHVLPVFREYERTMATVLNAALIPATSGYIARLGGRLEVAGVAGRLLVMQSHGGLEDPSTVQALPVRTVLSGPAAGVLGATRVARAAGLDDVISLDVGGTSTDVAFVRGGEPEVTDEGTIGPWPIALPMFDVHTVGSGGGSIAMVGRDGMITVGPRSAGSRPGPACYGLGGELATVTDADLVLGRLPDRIAGGTVPLDRAAALEAIRMTVGEPLDLDPIEAADGIVRIADDSIAAAIRLITTERGHDPRGHVLVAGGGAGPLRAAAVADLLEIRTVLVPARAGVLATLGLLDTDVRLDTVRTHVARLTADPPDPIRHVVSELADEVRAWFESERVPMGRRRTRWFASLRYVDQASELTVPWPAAQRPGRAGIAGLGHAFHRRHRDRYGYDLPDSTVELVALRVQASVVRSTVKRTAPSADRRRRRPTRRRPVWVDRRTGLVNAAVRGPDELTAVGIGGPAVIEWPESTAYVPPGWRARPIDGGDVLLERTPRR